MEPKPTKLIDDGDQIKQPTATTPKPTPAPQPPAPQQALPKPKPQRPTTMYKDVFANPDYTRNTVDPHQVQRSYWEEPYNVAKYYNLIRTAPQGWQAPDWLDADAVSQAYEYMRMRNGYKPVNEWLTLPKDDPATPFLQGMETPPDFGLMPKDSKFLPKPQPQPEQQPTEIPNFGSYEDLYGWQKVGLLLVGPQGNLAGRPEWNATASKILKTGIQSLGGVGIGSGIGAIIGGTIGALTTGGVGLLPGAALGAKIGGWIGGSVTAVASWQQMSEPEKDYKVVNDILEFADSLAIGTERLIGFGAQVGAEGWDKVMQDPEAAWRAGSVSYETAKTQFWNAFADLFGGEPATEGETWRFSEGFKDPVAVEGSKARGAAAIEEARARYQELLGTGLGEKEAQDQMIAEYTQKFGDTAIANDFVYQSVLDPANVIGWTTGKTGAAVAKAAGQPRLAEAFKMNTGSPVIDVLPFPVQPIVEGVTGVRGSKGLFTTFETYANWVQAGTFPASMFDLPTDTRAKYQELIKQGVPLNDIRVDGDLLKWTDRNGEAHTYKGSRPVMAEYPEVKDLSKFDKTIGGISDTYGLTSLEPSKNKGWLAKLWSLTPEAQAHTLLNLYHQLMATLMNRANGDPIQMAKFFEQAAGRKPVKRGDPAEGILKSPAMLAIQQAVQSSTTDGAIEHMVATWLEVAGATDPKTGRHLPGRRDLLNDIAKALHEKPADVLQQYEDNPETLTMRLQESAPELAQSVDSLKVFVGDDALPWNENQFQAMLVNQIADRMDAFLEKTYGLKPDHWIFRTSQVLKSLQSLVLLSLNPAYFFNNWTNNVATRAAVGVFGYMTPKQIGKFYERFGITPPRLKVGIGAADEGSTYGGNRIIADLKQSKDALGKAQRLTRNVTNKLGLFSRLSSTVEKLEGSQAHTIGTRQFFGKIHKVGVGIRKMHPALEAMLDRDAPGVKEAIYAAAEAGMNIKEVEAAIYGGYIKPQIKSTVSEVSARMFPNMPDAGQELLGKLGILDKLEKSLADAATPEDIDAAFDAIESDLYTALNLYWSNDVLSRADSIRAVADVERIPGILSIHGDMERKIGESWVAMRREWDELYARRGDYADKGAWSAAVRKMFDQQEKQWDDIYRTQVNTYAGMIDRLGIESQEAREYVLALGEAQQNWKEFHRIAKEKRNTYFDRAERREGEEYETYRARRDREYYTLLEELEELYVNHSGIEAQTQMRMNDLFAKGYEKFTNWNPVRAKAWRAYILALRSDLVQTQLAMRQRVKGMDTDARDAAYAEFNPVYNRMIADMKTAEMLGSTWIQQPPLEGETFEASVESLKRFIAENNEEPIDIGEPVSRTNTPSPEVPPEEQEGIPEHWANADAIMKLAKDKGIVDRQGRPIAPYTVNIINQYLRETATEGETPTQYTRDQIGEIPYEEADAALKWHQERHANDLVVQAVKAKLTYEQIVAEADRNKRLAGIRQSGYLTRANVRQQMGEAFKATETELDAVMMLMDMHAEKYGLDRGYGDTNAARDAWYATRISQIIREGGSARPDELESRLDQLFQDDQTNWYYHQAERIIEAQMPDEIRNLPAREVPGTTVAERELKGQDPASVGKKPGDKRFVRDGKVYLPGKVTEARIMPATSVKEQIMTLLGDSVKAAELKWLDIDGFIQKHGGETVRKADLLNWVRDHQTDVKVEVLGTTDVPPLWSIEDYAEDKKYLEDLGIATIQPEIEEIEGSEVYPATMFVYKDEYDLYDVDDIIRLAKEDGVEDATNGYRLWNALNNVQEWETNKLLYDLTKESYLMSREFWNAVSTLKDKADITVLGVWNDWEAANGSPGIEHVHFQFEGEDETMPYLDAEDHIADLVENGTLTEKEGKQRAEALERFGSIIMRYSDEFETDYADYTAEGGTNYREFVVSQVGRDTGFDEAHFQSPNYVFHFRTKDDEIGGRRYLRVEEIQSDLAKAMRQRGIKGVNDDKAAVLRDFETRRKELVERHAEKVNKLETLVTPEEREPVAQELARILGEYFELARKEQVVLDSDFTTAVPDSPFRETWEELAIKRIMRIAAEEGYDGVAIKPGAAHYDLYGSEIVTWNKADDGKFIVNASQQFKGSVPGIEDIGALADQVGKNSKVKNQIIESDAGLHMALQTIMPLFAPDRKDLYDANITRHAARIWKRMQQEDKGAYLPRKEGLEGFYDDKIANLSKDIGKRLGATPGQVEIAGYQWNTLELSEASRSQALEPMSLYQEHTPEFKAWFGKSKVVDADGNPLVVYHGTPRGGFEVFEWSVKKNQQLGFGTHFTQDEAYAQRYAEGTAKIGKTKATKPQVYKAFLSIKNPLNTDVIVNEGSPEFELAVKLAGSRSRLERLTPLRENGKLTFYFQRLLDHIPPEKAFRIIQEAGYDGIVYSAEYGTPVVAGGRIGIATVSRDKSWIVFNSNQIKSADNLNPTNDPSIYRQGTGKKGSTKFLDDGRAIIRAFEDAADISTMVHEVGHIFRRDLPRKDIEVIAKMGGLDVDSFLALEQRFLRGDETYGRYLWLQKRQDKLTEAQLQELYALEKNQVVIDMKKYVASEEIFARAWERYLAEGNAPTPEARSVFRKFTDWMLQIYGSLKRRNGRVEGFEGTPLNINIHASLDAAGRTLQDIFDDMLVTQASRPPSFMQRVNTRTDILERTGNNYKIPWRELQNRAKREEIATILDGFQDEYDARARADILGDEVFTTQDGRPLYDVDIYSALEEIEKDPSLNPWAQAKEVHQVYGTATTSASVRDPNKTYDFKYKLIDGRDLVASHNWSDNDVVMSTEYPAELQPRERQDVGAVQELNSRAQQLNPGAVIGSSGVVDRGSVIVRKDNTILSGNGRRLLIERAKTIAPEKFNEYLIALKTKLPEYGIDPAETNGMELPMLVQELQNPMSQTQLIDFVHDANDRVTRDMNDAEIAAADVRLISDQDVAGMVVGDNETIESALTSARNQPFVSRFFQKMSENERARYYSGGELTQAGINRLMNALFMKVYQGEDGAALFDEFKLSIDNNIKNVANGVFAALPQTAKAEGLINAGERQADLSITKDIAFVLNRYVTLKNQGRNIAEYIATEPMNMFGTDMTPAQFSLLQFIAYKATAKNIRDLLREYARLVVEEPDARQAALMPLDTTGRKDQLLLQAIANVEPGLEVMAKPEPTPEEVDPALAAKQKLAAENRKAFDEGKPLPVEDIARIGLGKPATSETTYDTPVRVDTAAAIPESGVYAAKVYPYELGSEQIVAVAYKDGEIVAAVPNRSGMFQMFALNGAEGRLLGVDLNDPGKWVYDYHGEITKIDPGKPSAETEQAQLFQDGGFDRKKQAEMVEWAKKNSTPAQNLRQARYVLPDGTMINTRGEHWEFANQYYQRDNMIDVLYDWLAETGSVRMGVLPFFGGARSRDFIYFEWHHPPTRAQAEAIADAVRAEGKDGIRISFEDDAAMIFGESVELGVDDIEEFFKGGYRRPEYRSKRNKGFELNQESQWETPEFKSWFGESAVVDDRGRPKRVYHGTKTEFDTFSQEKKGIRHPGQKSAQSAFFFTDEPWVAEGYAMWFEGADDRGRIVPREEMDRLQAGGQIVPVYLSIQNPLEVDFEDEGWDEQRYSDLIDKAIANGHDGIIIHNVDDSLTGDWSSTVYAVFESEQIKSAIGNRGTFDGSRSSMLFQDDDTQELAPIYYNKIERVIMQRMPNLVKEIPARTIPAQIEPDRLQPGVSPATVGLKPGDKRIVRDGKVYIPGRIVDERQVPAQSVKDQVMGVLAGMVKDDEIYWTGIEQYLDGKTEVTREEVANFLKDNVIEVGEVVHGEKRAIPPAKAHNLSVENVIEDTELMVKLVANGLLWMPEFDNPMMFELADKYDPSGRRMRFDGNGDDPSALTEEQTGLIGRVASAYYEVRDHFDKTTIKTKWEDINIPGGENYRELLITYPHRSITANTSRPLLSPQYPRTTNTDYRSSHWPDDNTMIHVRFDDRVDQDGKKVLNILEVQSDWHQEGRKRGYRDESNRGEVQALNDRINELNARDGEIMRVLLDNGYRDIEYGVPSRNAEPAITLEEADKLRREFREIFETKGDLFKKRDKLTAGVPQAPFAKNWEELAMKRMIRYAAEQGYDRVTFPTGVTAARIEGQQITTDIDTITWNEENNGLDAYKNGILVKSHFVLKEELPDYIGKDAAKQLLESHPEDLPGDVTQETEVLEKMVDGEKRYQVKRRFSSEDFEGTTFDITMHKSRKRAENDAKKPFHLALIDPTHEDLFPEGTLLSSPSRESLEKIVRKRILAARKVVRYNRDYAIMRMDTDPRGRKRTLKTKDITFGGENMRWFYDGILLNTTKDIARKYGSDVREGSISASEDGAGRYHLIPQEEYRTRPENEWTSIQDFDTYEEAAQYAELISDEQDVETEIFYREEKKDVMASVYSIDITPEMRETALHEGFELFQNDGDNLSFRDLKDVPSPMSSYIGNKRTMLQAGAYDGLISPELASKTERILDAFGGSGLLGNAFQAQMKKPRLLNDFDKAVASFHETVKTQTDAVVSAIQEEWQNLWRLVQQYPEGGEAASDAAATLWQQMEYRVKNTSDPVTRAAIMAIRNNGSLSTMGGGQNLISGADAKDGAFRWKITQDSVNGVIEGVKAHGKLLRDGNVTVRQGDARAVVGMATASDLLLVDPPYVERNVGDERVTTYAAGQDLSSLEGGLEFINTEIKVAAERDVPLIYTNNAHEAIINALTDIGMHYRLERVRSGREWRYEVLAWSPSVKGADTGERALQTESYLEAVIAEAEDARKKAIKQHPKMKQPGQRSRPKVNQQFVDIAHDMMSDAPIGATPMPEPTYETFTEASDDAIKPLLRRARETYKTNMTQGLKWSDVQPYTQQEVKKWVKQLEDDLSTNKLASMRYGEQMRDAALLNYTKRYGWDNIANLVYPYQFFYTRSMMNWLKRMVDKPSWFTMYARLMRAQEEQERKGLPGRLSGKIRIPMPWLPEWTGGGIWQDPFNAIFPFAQFGRPLKQLAMDQSQIYRRAESVLYEMVDAQQITQSQMEEALKKRAGSVWERAVKQAEVELGKDASPTNLVSMLMQPALWWTIPTNLASGTPEKISPLPITRTGQAIRTSLQGTKFEKIGNLTGAILAGGEEKLREGAGLSQFGEWGDYYIDRMLANMAADGDVTAQEANMAMMERTGVAFDEARRRVEIEMSLRVPGTLPIYALKEGANAVETAAAIISSMFPSGLLPTGELKQRGLKEEYDFAWKQFHAGDEGAIDKFFEDHPEYESRLALFAEPNERLRNFLVNEIWNRYTTLDKPNRQKAVTALGQEFEETFFADDYKTKVDLTEINTLAMWAQTLGGMVPQTEETKNAPTGYQPEWYKPQEVDAITAFQQERDRKFPLWRAWQDAYFQLPVGAQRKNFLKQYPQLRAYWDWREDKIAENPTIEKYTEDQSRAYAEDDLNDMSAALLFQIWSYFETGRPLSDGAMRELQMVWERNGRKGGTLEEYLDGLVAEAVK